MLWSAWQGLKLPPHLSPPFTVRDLSRKKTSSPATEESPPVADALMWNGEDEYVDYCHSSELHGSMAYALEKVVHVAPVRYSPSHQGYFLAKLLADTDWAEEAEAWLAERAKAERPAPSARPGTCRRALNPVTRPEPGRSPAEPT